MTREEIISAVGAVKNGHFVRVKYKSELPVKAAYKNQGVKLIKYTEVTVRLGVSYNNIEAVKKAKENGERGERAGNWDEEWIVPNKVLHNNHKDQDYLRFAYMPNGGNREVSYEVVDVTETYVCEELGDKEVEFVQPSYFKRAGSVPEVQNVKIENVISIMSKEVA